MTRILIVDDNATNLKLAADVLANPRCEVLRASDAREALEILALRRPDLILMDLAMPGTDGLSLTRRIKADARYCELPIVALTASAMKGDDQRALEAGCEGYITKPIDTRRFRQQVMAFLPSETDAEPAAPVATTARAGLRILAVDDSAQGRKLLRAGLENERCTVIEASNGREAAAGGTSLFVLSARRLRNDAIVSRQIVVELGPGKVLHGLNSRIAPGMRSFAGNSAIDLTTALAAVIEQPGAAS